MSPSRPFLCLAAVLLSAIDPAPLAAQVEAQPEDVYDIPARPLAAALDTFASGSKVSIAFEADVVATRQSAPLRGRFTAPMALRVMLAGTGLAARFTGPHSAIIYDPRSPIGSAQAAAQSRRGDRPTMNFDLALVRGPQTIGRRDPAAVNDYLRRAEQEIQAIFARHADYQGVAFRLRIAVSIDRRGHVDNVILLRPTGQRDRDAQIRSLVLGRTVGPPPPADLSQPLTFDVAGKALTARGRTP